MARGRVLRQVVYLDMLVETLTAESLATVVEGEAEGEADGEAGGG